MLGDIITGSLNQLDSLGFPGVVIVLLVGAIVHLWRALKAERERCKVIADKLHEMSKETIVMIERIIGSK